MGNRLSESGLHLSNAQSNPSVWGCACSLSEYHSLQEHLVSSADQSGSVLLLSPRNEPLLPLGFPIRPTFYHMTGGKGGTLYPRPERSQGEGQQNCCLRMGQTCSEVAQWISFTLMEQGPARERRDLRKGRYVPIAVRSFSKNVTAVFLFLF